MEYSIGTKVLDDWIIVEKLGAGASGTVFEIHKKQGEITQKSALKVICVPQSNDEVRRVLSEGIPMGSVSDYFMQIIEEIKKEVRTMIDLREHPNIVRFEDYAFIPNTSQVGGDILIRMELLHPLDDYLVSKRITEDELRRLAREVGGALDFCHKKKIMHRDIKPENIFINSVGQFKLGDFGLARTVEKSSGSVSKKGTESYMAPEVFLGKKYDYTVDIYSLGLVMYKCMNRNRLPFFPLGRNFTYAEREAALGKRIMGEPLPKPADAGKELGDIILKACAFEPAARYRTASEFLQAINPEVRQVKTPVEPAEKNTAATAEKTRKETNKVNDKKETKKPVNTNQQTTKKKSKSAIVAGIIVVFFIGLLNSGIFSNNGSISEQDLVDIKEINSGVQTSAGQTTAVNQNEQETDGVTCYLKQETNLREDPDNESGSLVNNIPQYAYVYTKELNENSEWTYVEYIGLAGWIKTELLVPFVNGDYSLGLGKRCYVNTSPGDNNSTVKVYTSPDALSPVVTEVTYGGEGTIGEMESGFWHVNVDGLDGWVYLNKFNTYVEGSSYEVIAKSGLKIRSDNDMNSSVVGKIEYGVVVTPEEFSCGWAKVTYGGKTGWVALKHMIPWVADNN